MEKAKVYFSDSRSRGPGEGLLVKLGRLFDSSGMGEVVKPGGRVAIKVHFGERGCTRFIRPIFIRRIVEKVREAGGEPFVSDSCFWGLSKPRSTAREHLRVAAENGFTPETLGAPIVIADGEWGGEDVKVEVDGRLLRESYVARAFAEADAMIVATHFKVGVVMGFSGSLKNVGVGCASKAGKWSSHARSKPRIVKERCDGCGYCLKYCFMGAITIEADRADIDQEKCKGCKHCIDVCPKGAVAMEATRFPEMAIRIIDVASAVIKRIGPKRVGYLNFLLDVTPRCDCNPFSDLPIVPDIGMLASKDPVAIDKASADLVNASPGIPGSAIDEVGAIAPGLDKFTPLNKMDWRVQLEAAMRLGLGAMNYELIKT